MCNMPYNAGNGLDSWSEIVPPQSVEDGVHGLKLALDLVRQLYPRLLKETLALQGRSSSLLTSTNVAAVANWPVRMRCSATVRSSAAPEASDSNIGGQSGNGAGNRCKHSTCVNGEINMVRCLRLYLVEGLAQLAEGVVYLPLLLIHVLLATLNDSPNSLYGFRAGRASLNSMLELVQ